jgi:putative Mg2+ transporter-C (MgtC) family protein
MSTSLQIAIRVLLATLCGGLIGLERELTDHPAGIRTHILVTVGACVFTAMSLFGFPGFLQGDRVAAAVVTGIGFIGGGAILRSRDGWVTGLTTAASLWSVAAIGMLFGTGYYAIGFVVTGIDLVVLELIDRIIDAISPRVKSRTMSLNITGGYTEKYFDEVMAVLEESECRPQLIHFRRLEDGRKMDMAVLARLTAGSDLQELTRRLYGVNGVSEVFWG